MYHMTQQPLTLEKLKRVLTQICTLMFIAALFITTNKLGNKQSSIN